MHSIDSDTPEVFATLFADDAVASGLTIVKFGLVKKGADALKGLCTGLHAKFSKCQHWEGNVMITPGSGGTVSETVL